MYAQRSFGFPPPPVFVPTVAPPSQQFVITFCFDSRENLIGVRRPNGIYYLYSYNCMENRMVRHACHCQPEVTEQNLTPLYAEWDDTKQILLCFNNLSSRVEKYVYDFDSDTFEQLEDTHVVHNPSLEKPPYSTIAVLRGAAGQEIRISKDQNGFMTKEMLSARHIYSMGPSRVRTSMVRADNQQRFGRARMPNHPVDADSEAEFFNYIDSIAQFIVRHCTETRQDIVIAFNYHREHYVRFYFDARIGEFCFLHCDCCPTQIRERDLISKYTELSPDGTKTVFHAWNTFTGIMEKYCFSETYGFEQVRYPELVYDESRTTRVTTLLLDMENREAPISITRNHWDGGLRVEQYCPIEQKYNRMDEMTVRTFLVQRKETERRRRIEERVGQEDDQEDEDDMDTDDDEQSSDGSVDSASDEEEDAAENEAEPPEVVPEGREWIFDSDGSDSDASEPTEEEFR